MYLCPSRGRPKPEPTVNDAYGNFASGGLAWSQSDYCANGKVTPNFPFVRTLAAVTDGLSQTFIVGEKAYDRSVHGATSWYWDEPIFSGGSKGTARSGLVIVQDGRGISFKNNWGSAHSAGAVFGKADGSTKLVTSSGWGQGLIFSLWLDDPEQSVLQVCLLALPGSGVSIRAEKIGRNVKIPMRKNVNIDFDSGKFVISRTGTLASFSVANGTKETKVFEAQCGSRDIQSISVWCTRQDQGNTPAEYLLRSLAVKADGFYSYQKTAYWFTW